MLATCNAKASHFVCLVLFVYSHRCAFFSQYRFRSALHVHIFCCCPSFFLPFILSFRCLILTANHWIHQSQFLCPIRLKSHKEFNWVWEYAIRLKRLAQRSVFLFLQCESSLTYEIGNNRIHGIKSYETYEQNFLASGSEISFGCVCNA